VTDPTISICLITYNHVSYIRQAIDGVLSQKHSYSFEFIIADDFSTDGTRDILLEYYNQRPSLLKLIMQDKNVGPAKNWRDLITAAKGKYLAYFEGDDCWTDNYKLQKQIDFLEGNPAYVLCCANARVENFTDKPFREIYCDFLGDKSFSQKEVLTEFYCPSLSLVFRNRVKELPEWLYHVKSGDTFLHFLLSKYGKFYFMDFIAGIYRQHKSGISNINNQIEWFKNNLAYLDKLRGYVEHENDCYLSEIIYRSQLQLIDLLRIEKKYTLALNYFNNMEKLPFFIKRKYVKRTIFSLFKIIIKK
jgi:glycosyltransferase involved in cell wall biosynthesis